MMMMMMMFVFIVVFRTATAFILNNEQTSTITTSFLKEKVFSDVVGFMSFPDDQITTSNPCLTHYCSKGRECWINSTGQPECVCQRTCPYRKKPICGTDGMVYKNHCELHRAACILNRPIAFQKIKQCSTELRPVVPAPSTTPSTNPSTTMAIVGSTATPPATPSLLYRHTVDLLDASDLQLNHIENHDNDDESAAAQKKGYCSTQEYEIMKDNLLLYSHTRLMTQNNNHSKDFLVSIMFSHYDQNNNGLLEEEELHQASVQERLDVLSNGCALNDMLVFDDGNNDRVLNINEFYQAFNKMYSLSVVSLDKALETNHLSARIGDNVEIKCDVSGLPSPPIIWQRYAIDLVAFSDDGVRVLSDGSLYLTNIQLSNAGNYSCHAQRNKDVLQTHILTVHTMPTVRIQPTMLSRRPQELCEISCHISGEPLPDVQWLKNDVSLDLGNERIQILGNGTLLRIHNLTYSDTGAYVCQASSIGGVVQVMSSLIVQDEPVPTITDDEHELFVFTDLGIDVYDPSSCGVRHTIHAADLIPGTKEQLCGKDGASICIWGRSVVVARHFIYVSQPTLNRILVLSTVQRIVIEIVPTDRYPVELFYVPHLDQVWLLNWRSHKEDASKAVQVIRNVSSAKHRHTLHTDTIEGQFDSVKGLYVPENAGDMPITAYKYGYVTHENQRGMYKLDLEHQRYTKSIDLTLYNCVPDAVAFSDLYGYVIISCREPVTGRKTGQLLMDYLTDSVLSAKPAMVGTPTISPDSRLVATTDHRPDGVTLALQKITANNGLEFLFDVKTTLNLSMTAFYESRTINGYDLFATASNKDDVLYLNLFSGKVEIIGGVGSPVDNPENAFSNRYREIKSAGLFGKYLATVANRTIYILAGNSRTIHCQIDAIAYPTALTWIDPHPFNNDHNTHSDQMINSQGY